MGRYLLFIGSSFYASGGWLDLVGGFDSIEEAQEHPKYVENFGQGRKPWNDTWYHIVDTSTLKIVAFVNGEHCGNTGEDDG